MDKNVYISVIVPVYNTEKYLDACIQSIVNQSYPSLQIILVDDGSSDHSNIICDAWEERDSRIQVIHQKNAGVSAARNAGLEIANGELISFVDSDDVLASDAYQHLIESLGKKDLVIGRMLLMEEDGIVKKTEQNFLPKYYSIEEFIYELFQEKRYSYLGYLCDKLMKRTIIQDNGIQFYTNVKLNEDRLFLLEYLVHCDSIAICDTNVYYYRQRSSSVITATRRNRTVTDSEMTVIKSFHKMLEIAKQYSEELYYIVARKAFESALDLRSRVAFEDKHKVKQIRRFMWESTRIYIQSPSAGATEKLKVIGHCILER